MVRYGFDAVRSSQRDLEQQSSLEGPLGLVLMKTALRVMNAIPPLKRKAFAGFGNS